MNFILAGRIGEQGSVLGIRPEHLRVVDKGRISGTVAHVERLGGDTNILADLGQGDVMTVRLFGQHDHQVGQTIALDFDDRHAFRFDADGLRVRS